MEENPIQEGLMKPIDKIEEHERTIQLALEKTSVLFDEIVHKSYLTELSTAEIIPYTGVGEHIRWYKITKIVYEKGVFFTDKIAILYASLHNVCSVVSLALKKRNGKMELYIGTRDTERTDFVSGKILESGIKGVLPGIEIEQNNSDMFEFFKEKEKSISCVSGIGSLTDDKKERFIQGLENLINATKEIPTFTALIIANKVSSNDAIQIQTAYENLYSEISPLAQIQRSYSAAESNGITHTITKGFNQSVTKNISRTISHGISKSSSCGNTTTQNEGLNLLVYTMGESVANMIQNTLGTTDSTADQTGRATANGEHEDEAYGKNSGTTQTHTIQITRHNRYAEDCMKILERQIERIQKSAPSGLWSVATYFVTDNNTTSQELAGIYRGIIVGDNSEVETVCINLWPRNVSKDIMGNPTVDCMMEYLQNQLHPQFKYKDGSPCTAGSLVDSKELAIHLSLPQSSVPGLLVREEKVFGRDVKAQEKFTDDNSITIGDIMHLGEIYAEEKVRLGINGLSKHTLITGSTGSGKSNTLYLLLSELAKKGKKFLVIEPAKGEYKEVFGNHPEITDVTVYGTNPRISKLLTINPFIFPDDIDVYEHIDSLVEIFNACWPMYAAMPQVMKHSIMEAYKSCGWNLSRSENTKGLYPTIEDVLDALKKYINSSEYSSNTKSDYKGSLETRLQSLCEGLVGRMFCGTPIPDEELFNANVIVDLSRVKSSETKSLLMGLLIMKLNEFRVSEHKGLNLNLRHVTILEEAHNLLKRTNTNQIAESSNITGMAVEKIANSMAEMRTYGEGFIVADQSPSMLDLATIRNTNTKIIMALPEKDDREIAGKSMGLNDEQIPEISRLKTGEAIVYQNGWEEAVKTKIIHIRKEDGDKNNLWSYDSNVEDDLQSQEDKMRVLFDVLYNLYAMAEPSYEKDDFVEWILNSPLSGRKKFILIEKVDAVDIPTVDDCALMMAAILDTNLYSQLKNTDIENISNILLRYLQQRNGLCNNIHIETIVDMYMRGCSLILNDLTFYEKWQTVKSRKI